MSNNAFVKRKKKFTSDWILPAVEEINKRRFNSIFTIELTHKKVISIKYKKIDVQDIYIEGNQLVMPWPDGLWEPYIHVSFKHELAETFDAIITDEGDSRIKTVPDPNKYSTLMKWLELRYTFARKEVDHEWISNDLRYIPEELHKL